MRFRPVMPSQHCLLCLLFAVSGSISFSLLTVSCYLLRKHEGHAIDHVLVAILIIADDVQS